MTATAETMSFILDILASILAILSNPFQYPPYSRARSIQYR